MFNIIQKKKTDLIKLFYRIKKENATQKFYPNAGPYLMRLLFLKKAMLLISLRATKTGRILMKIVNPKVLEAPNFRHLYAG